MVVVINPSEGKPSMAKSTEKLARVMRIGLDLAKTRFRFTASTRKARSSSLASFGAER